MADLKNCQPFRESNGHKTETVCIDANRVMDSCRDRDCFEDVRVYLTECGEELIDRVTNLRDKSAKVIGAYLDVEPVPFNRGFYQVYLRLFIKIVLEGCIAPGRAVEIEGLAVCEKKVILYGGEGDISVFRSSAESNTPCTVPLGGNIYSADPVAVCELVDPLILKTRYGEKNGSCRPCCRVDDIPDNICLCLSAPICDCGDREKHLYVTLGLFSVIRLERPGQFLVNAAEYAVPEKECVSGDGDDPCALFNQMEFPVEEFSTPGWRPQSSVSGSNAGSCKKCSD